MRGKSTAKSAYALALAIALFVFALHFLHILDFHEDHAVDLRFRLRGIQKPHPDIVLVTVDDASLSALGQWPWPRGIHAVLLDVISQYKPRLIFFDVLFTEASPNEEEDDKLGFSIGKAGNVILSFFYQSEKPFSAFFPIEKLRKTATGVAYVNVNPDQDGIVRKIRAYLKADGKMYYHPAVLAMAAILKDDQKFQDWLKQLPLERGERLWINYPGAFGAFKSISFAEIIDAVGTEREAELRQLFQDHIVLIGQTATGTTDISHTPFTNMDPGLIVQASVFHTILTGKFLHRTHEFFHLLILLFLALFTVVILRRNRPLIGLGLSLAFMAVYIVLNYLFFLSFGLILPLFTPLITVGVAYVLTLFMNYLEIRFQEEIMNRELQTAFRIQENFLPQARPQTLNLDVAYECRFAEQVGGDLYDWIDLGDGHLGVCVGDVSGKGVPAALYMARAISEFRRENKTNRAPGEVCKALNDLLAQTGTSGMFLTLLYAIVDSHGQKILYSSAGHEPIIVYRHKIQKAEVFQETQGVPLGLFEGQEYPSVQIPFEEGDVFLMISDGVRELRNPAREQMGIERLRQIVEREALKQCSALEMVQRLFQAMEVYQRGALPHDDRTLFCIRFV